MSKSKYSAGSGKVIKQRCGDKIAKREMKAEAGEHLVERAQTFQEIKQEQRAIGEKVAKLRRPIRPAQRDVLEILPDETSDVLTPIVDSRDAVMPRRVVGSRRR